MGKRYVSSCHDALDCYYGAGRTFDAILRAQFWTICGAARNMNVPVFPCRNILREIDRLTTGEYECFAGRLVGFDDPRPSIAAESLLDQAMRDAIYARFAVRFESFDARAVLSIWTKWYLNAFLPPVLLADLLLTRGLSVPLDRVEFIVGEDSRVSAIKMDGAGQDTMDASAFDRFEHLIFDHFDPLIEMWSERSEITRRVLWSNVGNTFEAMLCRVEAVSGASLRLEGARHLLNQSVWPGGRSNPLHAAVHYVADGDAFVRRRRICCLQYLLPDRRFCNACPIDEAKAAAPDPHPTAFGSIGASVR
jgi:ferric iron reductase protein FhuF